MKDRARPGLSRWGAIIALALGTAGIAATPLWACPPEKEEQAKKAKEAELAARARVGVPAAAPGVVVATPRAAKAPNPPKPPKAPRAARAAVVAPTPETIEAEAATTFEQHMREREAALRSAAGSPAPAPPDDRIEELNRRLERLEQRLNELLDGRQSMAEVTPLRVATAMGQNLSVSGGVLAPSANGPTIPRTYALPQGKLDALVGLMARQDVPIYISREADGITVNATPQQHQVFEMFIQMIHPGASAPTGELPAPRHGAGVSIEGQVFAATLASLAADAAAADAAARDLAAQAEVLAAQAEALEAQAEALEETMENATGADRETARSRLSELLQQRRALEQAARDMEREADRLSDHAESCRERAEECHAEHESACEEAATEAVEEPEE